ncbi:MAG: FkbM family methyltransferase [Pseudohongiellaceae bacterium]
MKTKLLGLARYIGRKTLPVSLRRKIWTTFLGRYFDRSSVKAIVAYAEVNKGEQSAGVMRLINVLKTNNCRPDYELISNEIGLHFKGFSCQDLIAYIYFNGKKSGFFIDIGAYDGVAISNTFFLEQLGWKGICVEPIPEIYSLLQKNRDCYKYNAAISSTTDSGAPFLKVSNLAGLSGLESQMPDRIRKGLEKQGLDIEKIVVNTLSFDDVMKNHPQISYIDFLSIDVEGGELDVLKTIDFGRFRFGLVTIENNAGTGQLRNYMLQNGYNILFDLGVDLMFVPG